MDFRHWLHGLAAVVINGAASGALMMFADPSDFNFAEGRTKLLTLAVGFGLVAALNYLKQSPLPGLTPPAPPAVDDVTRSMLNR